MKENQKKKKPWLIAVVVLAAVLLLTPALLAAAAFATPAVYTDTFVGALGAKYDRLRAAGEGKIVVVGGSSVAFGIDSAILAEYTGRPVVNFGLYSALGTKMMMDLSLAGIEAGDVVVLAPELERGALSLAFHPDTALTAADGHAAMLRRLPVGDRLSLLGALPHFLAEKASYLKSGERPHGSGAYDPQYFNENGDLTYPRPENVMALYYDPNVPVTFDVSMLEADFLAYVNDYAAACRGRGASVVFAWPPMNALAVPESVTEETIAAFAASLTASLECPVIGFPEDHILPAGYFYDSNFHLNDAGVTVHTVRLLKELLLELGTPVYVGLSLPEEPALPEKEIRFFGAPDANERYFTWEKTDFGIRLTGLTEEGKTQTALTVPIACDGYRVALLGEGFLAGGAAEKLIIPQGFEQFITDTAASMMTLENGCFDGASSLHELWIYNRHEATVMPPASFTGVSADFVIHVPEMSYYNEGYFWGERRLNGVPLTFITDIVLEP